MVIEKNFYVLCVIAGCAIVSHETLVKRCNLYLHLQPDKKYLSHWEFVWESSSDNSTSHLNDDMLPHHHTAIYLLWGTAINGG